MCGWSHASSRLVLGELPQSLCKGRTQGWLALGAGCSLDVEVLFLEEL